MTIKSSGSLALTEIQTEFGGSNPVSLSEYVRGGTYVDNVENSSIPTSLSNISVSKYYSKTKYRVLTVTHSTALYYAPLEIKSYVDAIYGSSSVPYYLTFNLNAQIVNRSTRRDLGFYGPYTTLTTGTFPTGSILIINLNSNVYGGAGWGGAGGSNGSAGSNGDPGTDAISLQHAATINVGQYVTGGGGGGGGGGSVGAEYYRRVWVGGGGGGAGWGDSGSIGRGDAGSSETSPYYPEQQPGNGGYQLGLFDTPPGSYGGQNGVWTADDDDQSGGDTWVQYISGAGGNGGAPGVAGAAGSPAAPYQTNLASYGGGNGGAINLNYTSNYGTATIGAGGSGGTAGYAIRRNGYTLTLNYINGRDSTFVKGTVG